MHSEKLRQFILSSALAASLPLSVSLVHAADTVVSADQVQSFDIKAQPLAAALNAFALQTHQQILFTPEVVKGKQSQGVTGQFSAHDALVRLLGGTGLVSSRTAEGMLMVTRADAGEASASSGPPIAPEGASTAQSPLPPSSDLTTSKTLDEVVVTGTYIHGSAPVGSPLTIYSREDIEKSGAATLADFARKMPQNYSSVDPTAAGPGSAGGLDQSGINVNGGAGFNLQGIGPEATLTLVDGNRLAPAGSFGGFVDISLIPLAAIDRVEVLGDGASALYGADAIAGVVNIILRRDFQGAESSVRYGSLSGGDGKQLTASQIFGTNWSGGNAMLVYEYHHDDILDASQRSFIPPLGGPYTLIPKQNRNSVLFRGFQQVADLTTVSVDAYYSDRRSGTESLDFYGEGGNKLDTQTSGRQYGATVALNQRLPGEWQADFSGDISKLDQSNYATTAATDLLQNATLGSRVTTARLVFNGPLFHLFAGPLRMAAGAEYRKDKFTSDFSALQEGESLYDQRAEQGRNISSVFGELLIPLVDDSNAVAWTRGLELSVAGRYDHYSDVGSSTNPKIGIAWAPNKVLTVKSSYGRSFRAPPVQQLVDDSTFILYPIPNPQAPPTTNTLIIQGSGNLDLKPERSRAFTAGLDLDWQSSIGLKFSANYFNIRFENRVALPPILGKILDIWSQTDSLAPFFNFAPTPAQVAAIFNSGHFINDPLQIGASGVQAIFDNRFQNIAITRDSGIALGANYLKEIGPGSLGLSLDGNYILKTEYQADTAVAGVDLNNKVGQPARLKLRSSATWSQGGFNSSVFVNYVGPYDNPLVTPTQAISSWTTADVQLGYKIGNQARLIWLNKLTFSFTVQNVFDKLPPYVAFPDGVTPLGFDSTNASPFGRILSVQVTKAW